MTSGGDSPSRNRRICFIKSRRPPFYLWPCKLISGGDIHDRFGILLPFYGTNINQNGVKNCQWAKQDSFTSKLFLSDGEAGDPDQLASV